MTMVEVPARAASRFDVGIVIARHQRTGPWPGITWSPHAVLPGVPDIAPGTRVGGDNGIDLIYVGLAELSLTAGATSPYRDNLSSRQPSLWVAIRADDTGQEIVRVTADPYEGEALTDGLGDIVEALPMPDPIRQAVESFVAAFHVERPFIKRRREKWHKAEARRPRVADGPEVA